MPTTPVLNDRQKIAALPEGTIFIYHHDTDAYNRGDYILPYVKAEDGARAINNVCTRATVAGRCDNATEPIMELGAFPTRWRFTIIRYGQDGEVYDAL